MRLRTEHPLVAAAMVVLCPFFFVGFVLLLADRDCEWPVEPLPVGCRSKRFPFAVGIGIW